MGAHRGASSSCPENTMAAFRKALDLSVDMLELDIQLTKDGEVVIYHDFYLEKRTNGHGFLRDYTLAELKKLDAGSWFSPEFAGETIPTLEEVLAWSKDKIWLSIELKQLEVFNEPLAKKTVELIKSYKMEDQVQIMSFNHQSLVEARKSSRKIITNVISASRMINPIQYLNSVEAQVLNVPIIHLSPSLIKELHEAGFYVHGSMSDDIDVFRRLLEWGADAMDTNTPDLMLLERSRLIDIG
ncbi:MAG: glycerophosphodiester phosphodiesterase [Bacillota bacterium]